MKKNFLVFCLFFLATIYSTYPVFLSPERTITDRFDGIFITWTINQTIGKIPHNLGNVFEGNIFYPEKHTLAFSDLFVPEAVLSVVPVQFLGEPLLAFNINFILSQFLLFTLTFVFWKKLTKDTSASMIAALALGLSQIRFHYTAHLQMWASHWWLLALYFFYNFLETKRRKSIFLASSFAGIQAWQSPFPLYLLAFAGAPLLILNKNIFLKNFKKLLLPALLFIAAIFPMARIYYIVSHTHHFARSIREAAHFSAGFDELATTYFSPGLHILLLAALYILYKKHKLKTKSTKWLLSILLIAVLMSLGPVLKFHGSTVKIFNLPIPLPYALAHYLIPGFKALRTPSRWLWLAAFAASGLIASGLKELKLSKHKSYLLVAIALAIFGGTRLVHTVEIPKVREYPVYQFLKNYEEGKVVLELPVYVYSDGEVWGQEQLRMLASLSHGKKLVNGTTSFYPEDWERLIVLIREEFPSKKSLDAVKANGVDTLIIHKDQVDISLQEQLIWEDQNSKIYKLK